MMGQQDGQLDPGGTQHRRLGPRLLRQSLQFPHPELLVNHLRVRIPVLFLQLLQFLPCDGNLIRPGHREQNSQLMQQQPDQRYSGTKPALAHGRQLTQ